MKKFLVLYIAPASVMEAWKQTDPDQKSAAEAKMKRDWKTWMSDHASSFVDAGGGLGKTQRITAKAVADTRNDLMLYAVVQAESQFAAAKIFEAHPHLQIPEASIDVIELHPLPGT